MKCPRCQSPIPNQNINIATDVAQCEECHLVFKISENLSSKSRTHREEALDANFNIGDPPKGAWIRQGSNELIIGATTRSYMALFLVPFMIIWSGGSLGGIYGSQIMMGEFNLMMSLFGIPFLLGSILFWSIALMTVVGKVEITLDHTDGKVFTGVGKIGYTKRFELSEIQTVRESQSSGRRGSSTYSIALEGQRRITFGTLLNESRRYYLLKVLQKVVTDKANNRNFLTPNLMRHLIKK